MRAEAKNRDVAVGEAVAELLKRTNTTVASLDRRVDDLETPDLVPAWRHNQADEDVSALRGQVQSLELRLSSLCRDLRFESPLLSC